MPRSAIPAAGAQPGARNPYAIVSTPKDPNGVFSYFAEWQRCIREKLCPAGTACQISPAKQIGCYKPNCRSLGDVTSCAPDEICYDFGSSFFHCAPAGEAKVGADCAEYHLAPLNERCAAGAVCWGGKCRAVCDSAHPCRSGQACWATNSTDSLCVDKKDLCESNADCGDGECMKRPNQNRSTCVQRAVFPDGSKACRSGECDAGLVCEGPVWGATRHSRCRAACDEHRPCPAGSACDGEFCRATCEPGGDKRCYSDESCQAAGTKAGEQWLCQ
jgi:hypothetical protein